jgi:LuxR family maltose regulon positive regulatory protein
MLHHEMGDQEASSQYLIKCRELGERTALPDWPWRWRLAQARLKEASEDWEAALDLLEEANRLYVRIPIPDFQPLAARKARVYVRQGRLVEANAWVRERGLSTGDELVYLKEFEHITLCRVFIARYLDNPSSGTLPEAFGFLERLLAAAEDGGRKGSAIEILILGALAHQAQGDISQALELLERALTLAEPEGYARIFRGEGSPMEKLLTAAAARGILPKYVARLLGIPPPEERINEDKASPPSTLPAQPLIAPLSRRELEVLRLVAQGLSNDEISKRLFLALSTVKGHNLRIFAKLQANNRTEAVARARELGLL